MGFPHFPWILSRSPLELNCFLCVPSVVLWCPWYCQQFWVPTPPKTKTVSVFSLLSRQTLLQSAFWTSKATNLATVNFFLAPRPQNHGTVSIFWLPGPRILVLSALWVPKALVSIFKPPGPQTLGNVSESLQFSLLSLWYFFETQWLHELSFQIRWRPISLRFPLASFETNRLPLVCHCNPLEYLDTHWFLLVSLINPLETFGFVSARFSIMLICWFSLCLPFRERP